MYAFMHVCVYIANSIYIAGGGIDYIPISTTLTSSPGTNTINGSIDINNDDQNEDTEMFSILIYNCTNSLTTCDPGLMNNLVININDDANDCK